MAPEPRWATREIAFKQDSFWEAKATPSKYLLGDSSTLSAAVSDIDDLLYDGQFPEIALTFIDGCEEQPLKEDVKSCLRTFITSILGKLSCLLITRGSHVGVTKLVGKVCSTETLKWNYSYVSKTIGVLPWSYVRGKESLTSDGGTSPIEYNPDDAESSKGWLLDPNQDFYFLIEGDQGLGLQIDIIAKMNAELREENDLPCVMILTGGGKWSLKAMHGFLFPNGEQNEETEAAKRQNLNKPVVIVINGSGKLADLLSAYVARYQNHTTSGNGANDQCNEDNAVESAIEALRTEYEGNSLKDSKSKELFDTLLGDTNESENYKSMFKRCISKKLGQIFIYKLEDESNAEGDLETVLYRAAIAAEPISKTKALFAILSDDKDIVRAHLKENPKWAYSMMTDAIRFSNRLHLIRELLEVYEIDIEDYVKEELWELYKFYKLERKRVAASEFDTGKLAGFLHRVGYNSKGMTTNDNGTNWRIIDCLLNDLSEENIAETIRNFELDDNKMKACIKNINPIQALLINSILCLDIKAAKLFWYFDQYNPLSNALLAYVLLSGLKKKAVELYESSKNEFEESLGYFNLLICTLLDNYYKTNKDMTKKVLQNKHPIWKDKTVIDVAGDIGFESIFGTQACRMFVMGNWNKAADDKKLPDNKNSAKENCKECMQSFWQSFTSPLWKMRLHLFMYLLSLIGFAFFVIFTNTVVHDPINWAVLVVVVSLAVDEVRQIDDNGKTWHRNIKQWASSYWNILDASAITLFITGFILSYHHSYLSKIMLALYLCASSFKILQFLSTRQSFGTYMVMIGKMVGRMRKFFVAFLVSILGYGLFMTALLHPNAKLDWMVLFHVLFRPYLLLVGDPGIESFEMNASNTVFGTSKVGLLSEILVIIGMALFVLFANILLVNLLIADFSYIHGNFLERSEETLVYGQYLMQQEYERKPSLPIPFSIFENLYVLLGKRNIDPIDCMRRLCTSKKSQETAQKAREDEMKSKREKEYLNKRQITDFERFCFRKSFPKIPDNIIYPDVQNDEKCPLCNQAKSK